MNKPLLTISILLSNRMDTIARCLDSLKPILEAIPSELILTDTSKNPDVRELALKYTDKVETFEWCDDFAKARNVGLKKAQGEWFMFIDDDEWFLDANPLIDFFKSGKHENFGYAHYRVRNYHDTDFKTYTDGWVSRIVKLQKGTMFHSKVHEYLAPIAGKDINLDALIGHSGYIFITKEDKRKHFKRNSELIAKMEEEEPDNLRWKVQQIQEYRSMEDYVKLEQYCKKTLQYLEKQGSTKYIHDLLQINIGYTLALLNNGKFEEVKSVYKKCEEILRGNLMSKAFMDACLAEAYYNLGDYEKVKKHVSLYLDAYKQYQKNPEQSAKEAIRLILSEIFLDEKYCASCSMLLSAELKLGNHERIYTLYPELKWDSPNVKEYCGLVKDLLNRMLEWNDEEMLVRILRDCLSSVSLKSSMMKAILDLQKNNNSEFLKVLELVKSLDIDAWYKPYAALLLVEDCGTKEEVKKEGLSLLNKLTDKLKFPQETRQVLENYNIQVEELYLELSFAEWKEALIYHLERSTLEKMEQLKTRLENSCLKDDIRFGYFMIVYSEQKLIKGIEDGINMDEYSNLLLTFSQYTQLTYEALFGEQIQQMELEELPENYQAALWLKVFFEEVENDLKSALACLGKVATAYPMMSRPMRYYLTKIKEELL